MTSATNKLLIEGFEFEDPAEVKERLLDVQILAANQTGPGEPAFVIQIAAIGSDAYAELTKKYDRKRSKVGATGKQADFLLDQIDAEFEVEYCELIGRGWTGATLRNLEALWSSSAAVPKRTPEYEKLKADRAEVRFSQEWFRKVHHDSWAPLVRNAIFNKITEVTEADRSREADAKKL